jgi:transcriptional regulator with XRE-family HTH domain
MTLSLKLKKLREKNGLSLQQVADAVGISKAHVWELERGSSTNPGVELLGKISAFFKVPVTYLMDDSIEPTEASALQFFREFEGKLSEGDWETLRTVAGALKKEKKNE